MSTKQMQRAGILIGAIMAGVAGWPTWLWKNNFGCSYCK